MFIQYVINYNRSNSNFKNTRHQNSVYHIFLYTHKCLDNSKEKKKLNNVQFKCTVFVLIKPFKIFIISALLIIG